MDHVLLNIKHPGLTEKLMDRCLTVIRDKYKSMPDAGTYEVGESSHYFIIRKDMKYQFALEMELVRPGKTYAMYSICEVPELDNFCYHIDVDD
jgi:hypothetical protein